MSAAITYGKRELGIALIIGAIILTLLVWNVSIYAQIDVLQTDKRDLQEKISELQNDKEFLQNQIQQFQDEYRRLRWEKDFYESIANFSRSTDMCPPQTITIDAGVPTFIVAANFNYAGYLEVTLDSTSISSYVIIEYSSKAGDFNFQKTLGTHGTEIFFILPTPFAKMSIGNTETSGTVNVTYSVTYYY